MMRFRRPILLTLLVATIAFGLSSCSSGGSTASSSGVSTNNQSTPETTPSGRPATGTNTVAVVTTPQTQVQSQIVETPPEALSIQPTAQPAPTLATDYQPAPANESTVLEATVKTVHVYASATSAATVTTLTNPLPSGAPLTFLVDGQTSTRYKVLLPIKPNGSTGWLDPAEVGTKRAHAYKIVVELAAHRITVTNGNQIILSEPIGVGKGSTPTPNGRYYIKELLKPPNPNGAYGPYAYGLSGFSPIVQNFNGGDDTIGIHGTDHPELIGQDVSHGCIRMSNTGITTLAKILPLGTPVIVKA